MVEKGVTTLFFFTGETKNFSILGENLLCSFNELKTRF